jgi:hypothetical protein
MREYQIMSPSLEGVLQHYSVMYEGMKRPVEVLRALDGPARRGSKQPYTAEEQKVLEEYFRDMHTVFLKQFSVFIGETYVTNDDTLRLQAVLQELIKVKKLIMRGQEID